MEKIIKPILILIIAELTLLAYYIYQQPQCEPCLPNTDCPPCRSDEQVMAIRAGILIGVLSASYMFLVRRRAKSLIVRHKNVPE